ncbi:MAG: biopolymer transporter ExbD [Alistipes sp.]|nr:biopolymer transporter ExbD [Alistipes sp.]
MATDKRKVQEINAGSMADIAFLLLIFFLVATTMNVDTGIARNLPPMPPENQQVEDLKVRVRNVLPVLINGRGDLFVGRAGEQEYLDIHQLKDRAKEFLLNPMDDPNLPEKEMQEFDLPDGSKWTYAVGKGVLSLQTTKDTQYQNYIMVQNELTRAVNEIRDEVARAKFQKKFAELAEGERAVVAKAVPMSISEAEPRDLAGRN